MQDLNSYPEILTGDPAAERSASLVLDSGAPVLSRLDSFISRLKTAWEIDEDTHIRIQTCMEEAVLNAIVHGNRQQYGKYVHVYCRLEDRGYTFAIQDEGSGFDYRSIADPGRGENLCLPGGRGIFIIRLMSDAMNFFMNGKYLKLFFHNQNSRNHL